MGRAGPAAAWRIRYREHAVIATLRLTLLGLLALAPPAVLAGRWQPVIEGPARAIYLDTAGLAREGAAGVRAWTREVYTQEQRSDQVGVLYYSVNALIGYECAKRTWVPLFKVFFGADGTELRRVSLDAVEAPLFATPGSLQEGLLERACTAAFQPPEAKPAAPVKPVRAAPAASGKLAGAAAGKTVSVPPAAPAPEATEPAKAAEAKGADAPPAGAKSAEAKPAAPASAQQAQSATSAAPPAGNPAAGPTAPAPRAAESAAKAPAAATAAPAAYEPPPHKLRLQRTAGYERLHGKPRPAGSHGSPGKAAAQDVHWSYAGTGGPHAWAKLNPDYAQCATGTRQSPIDISGGARLELEPIRFDYRPTPLRMIDNGHTVQVNYAEGSSITVNGERFDLKQFHFHKPAEERIDGRGFDMSVHLVHVSPAGRIAVVTVLLESRKQDNGFLRALWPYLPLEPGREVVPGDVSLDAATLLPETRTYFTYIGSLTTPPCTEGVTWLVLKTPVEVSPDQVAVFSKLYSMNARPLQPTHGRLIKESM